VVWIVGVLGVVARRLDFSRGLGIGEGERYEKMTVRGHDKNSLIAKVFIFKYNLPLSIYQQSHLRIFIRLRKIWKISH
jgi:hypothetical protein